MPDCDINISLSVVQAPPQIQVLFLMLRKRREETGPGTGPRLVTV